MKRIIIKLFVFLSPIVIPILFLEFYIRSSDNAFTKKAAFINNNPDIELLILGSSHNQNNINPKYLDLKTSNLAYGMQDLQLDSALLMSKVKKLSKLKYVILEIDYLTLFRKNLPDYFRYPWYYIYHDIQIHQINRLEKLFIYFSSPEFFNNALLKKITDDEAAPLINKFGFNENNFSGLFADYKFNHNQINLKSSLRMRKLKKGLKIENYHFNTSKMNSLIHYCNNHNIEVILISSPVFHTYSDNYNDDMKKLRLAYIDSLKSNTIGLQILNYEEGLDFHIRDFKDDDHLNPRGAKKFSNIINSKINRFLNQDSISN